MFCFFCYDDTKILRGLNMDLTSLIDSNFFMWVVMPVLIFLARICDVSIGTVRIMLLARGKRFLAPLLGFFEMLVWLLAVRQVIFNLANWECYFAFAAGFAAGNYVGVYIEEKLAMGIQVIRIITQKDAGGLIKSLREGGYGATVVDAQGAKGDVNLIFTIVNRRDQIKVIELVKQFNPKAFYSVEDVRSVAGGFFPAKNIKTQL